MWNEAVEKVNVDFDWSRKEFWVGERKVNITSLKSDAGVSLTSKLEVLQRHYQHLEKVSDFDTNWT